MSDFTVPRDELETLAARVVALVEERGAALAPGARVEANVGVSRTRHGLTRFANSAIHQHVNEDVVGLALTLAVDRRCASASTTGLDLHEVRDLVDRAIASARLQPVDPYWPGATPPSEVTRSGHLDEDTASATPEQRVAEVKRFVEADRSTRAAGYLDTAADWAAFASTAGQRTSGATSRATIDGIHQTEESAGGAHQTSVALGELNTASAGVLAADRARRSVEVQDLAPGSYEVVLGPEAVSTVLTFLCFYGFNAKSHLDGASFVELGTPQLDEAVTILEDPQDPRAIGLPFDAEGSPRRRFSLVERGVPRSLAHDRRTARRAGTTTTGNAVPGGAGVGAFPMNVVMPAGDRPVEDLVAGVARGLLITQFHYVRVLDPKSVAATGLTRNGTFLIEDGEISGAVSNLRFTQSFVEALTRGQVAGVGDDDRYADGEFGPGMVICPSLHLRSWNFTGGAAG